MSDDDDSVPAWKRKLQAVRQDGSAAPPPETSAPAAKSQHSKPRSKSAAQAVPATTAEDILQSLKAARKEAQQPSKAGSSSREQAEDVAHRDRSGRTGGRSAPAVDEPTVSRQRTAASGGRDEDDRSRRRRSRDKGSRVREDEPGRGGGGSSTVHRLADSGSLGARPKVLQNHKRAMAVFSDDHFNVQDFINATYQDAEDAGVEAAAASLLGLRETCQQQVQQVVLTHHRQFIEVCRERQVVDEAVSELRPHVQDVVALVTELQHEASRLQQARSQGLGGRSPSSPGTVLSPRTLSTALGPPRGAVPTAPTPTGRPTPVKDALDTQLRSLLQQLALAVSEKEYGAAVGLLGLLGDVMAVVARDASSLAEEVRDVAAWRQPWTAAIAEQRRALASDLETVLSRAAVGLSAVEARGAAAALAALAGDAHAASALLASHGTRIEAERRRLLRLYNSDASSEQDAAHVAGALCQAAFLGVAAAAEDVAAVWGAGTLPAAPLLAQWAEHEARRVARVVRQTSLQPYADSTPVSHTLECVQVCCVTCGVLGVSHGLSLVPPLMAELWAHVEEVVRGSLAAAATAVQAEAEAEVATTLAMAEPAKAQQHMGPPACAKRTVAHIGRLCRSAAPLGGPRLAACLRPGLLAVLAALIDGVVSGLQQQAAAASSSKGAAEVARAGNALVGRLAGLLAPDGAVAQAVSPLIPTCGPLLDLAELRGALSDAADALGSAVGPSGPAAPPSPLPTPISARRQDSRRSAGSATGSQVAVAREGTGRANFLGAREAATAQAGSTVAATASQAQRRPPALPSGGDAVATAGPASGSRSREGARAFDEAGAAAPVALLSTRPPDPRTTRAPASQQVEDDRSDNERESAPLPAESRRASESMPSSAEGLRAASRRALLAARARRSAVEGGSSGSSGEDPASSRQSAAQRTSPTAVKLRAMSALPGPNKPPSSQAVTGALETVAPPRAASALRKGNAPAPPASTGALAREYIPARGQRTRDGGNSDYGSEGEGDMPLPAGRSTSLAQHGSVAEARRRAQQQQQQQQQGQQPSPITQDRTPTAPGRAGRAAMVVASSGGLKSSDHNIGSEDGTPPVKPAGDKGVEAQRLSAGRAALRARARAAAADSDSDGLT